MLFHVIPAKAGIQCFQGGKNALDPGFHRGDEYSVIFSHLPFFKGGKLNPSLWRLFPAKGRQREVGRDLRRLF